MPPFAPRSFTSGGVLGNQLTRRRIPVGRRQVLPSNVQGVQAGVIPRAQDQPFAPRQPQMPGIRPGRIGLENLAPVGDVAAGGIQRQLAPQNVVPRPQMIPSVAGNPQAMNAVQYAYKAGYKPLAGPNGEVILQTDPRYSSMVDNQQRPKPGVQYYDVNGSITGDLASQFPQPGAAPMAPAAVPGVGVDPNIPFRQQAESFRPAKDLIAESGTPVETRRRRDLLMGKFSEKFMDDNGVDRKFNSLDEYDAYFRDVLSRAPDAHLIGREVYDSFYKARMPANVKAEFEAEQVQQAQDRELRKKGLSKTYDEAKTEYGPMEAAGDGEIAEVQLQDGSFAYRFRPYTKQEKDARAAEIVQQQQQAQQQQQQETERIAKIQQAQMAAQEKRRETIFDAAEKVAELESETGDDRKDAANKRKAAVLRRRYGAELAEAMGETQATEETVPDAIEKIKANITHSDPAVRAAAKVKAMELGIQL